MLTVWEEGNLCHMTRENYSNMMREKQSHTATHTATNCNTLQYTATCLCEEGTHCETHTWGHRDKSQKIFWSLRKHTNICIAYIYCICIVYIYTLHVCTAFMRYLHTCTRGETQTNLMRFLRFLVEHTNIHVAYIH